MGSGGRRSGGERGLEFNIEILGDMGGIVGTSGRYLRECWGGGDLFYFILFLYFARVDWE